MVCFVTITSNIIYPHNCPRNKNGYELFTFPFEATQAAFVFKKGLHVCIFTLARKGIWSHTGWRHLATCESWMIQEIETEMCEGA